MTFDKSILAEQTNAMGADKSLVTEHKDALSGDKSLWAEHASSEKSVYDAHKDDF